MSLIDYGSILLRRGWILVLLALLAAGSAFLLSRFQTPIYRATQTVLIQPARPDLGLTESATRLVRQYAVYLDSDFTAARVIDALRLDLTPGDLNALTVVNADALRFTIQIEVDYSDPEVAKQIAQEFGNQLVTYRFEQNQRNRIEDRIEASLADVARASLDRPQPVLNAAAGGVLGLLLGGLIVFVLEYLESAVIRRGDDIERNLNLSVLASIPDTER